MLTVYIPSVKLVLMSTDEWIKTVSSNTPTPAAFTTVILAVPDWIEGK